jgi:hypothetical protein
MPIPENLLAEISNLSNSVARVMSSIEAVIDPEYRQAWNDRSVNSALQEVEDSVSSWIRASLSCERQLLAQANDHPEDADEVQARLGAFMMLHITVASDVAKLLPFDDASDGAMVLHVHAAAANLGIELPRRADAIREVALGPDGLVQSMSSLDKADDVDGAEAGPDGITVAAVLKEDLDELVGDIIDDVVTDLVERAAKSSTGVLMGLAGGGLHVLADLLPHLSGVANAVPDDVRHFVVPTVKRVARLVRILVARGQAALTSVLQDYGSVVKEMIKVAEPAVMVSKPFAGNIVGRVTRSKEVRKVARVQLNAAADRKQCEKRLLALKRTHRKWVGPVRIVAGGLRHLWAVPVGPVPIPAAPVAAVALLGWTVLITGDLLDSRGYPDCWKGVIRRASGE